MTYKEFVDWLEGFGEGLVTASSDAEFTTIWPLIVDKMNTIVVSPPIPVTPRVEKVQLTDAVGKEMTAVRETPNDHKVTWNGDVVDTDNNWIFSGNHGANAARLSKEGLRALRNLEGHENDGK